MTIVADGWHCAQCGMSTEGPADYHPYAACLMFAACRNGDVVQANLDAVVQYGRALERQEHERAQNIAVQTSEVQP